MYEKLLCSIPNTGKSQMRNSLPGILSVCSGLSPRVEEQCCAALCTICSTNKWSISFNLVPFRRVVIILFNVRDK